MMNEKCLKHASSSSIFLSRLKHAFMFFLFYSFLTFTIIFHFLASVTTDITSQPTVNKLIHRGKLCNTNSSPNALLFNYIVQLIRKSRSM